MQSERGNLDVVEVMVRLSFEPRVARDREGDFKPTFHCDVDLAVFVMRLGRLINQYAHSRIEL